MNTYVKSTTLITVAIFSSIFVSCKEISKEEKKTNLKNKVTQIAEKTKNNYSKKELVGFWMRNQDGVKDILELRENGTFSLAGNPYWVGRNWKFKNDSIHLELVGLTNIDDDFSYVSYAVVPKNNNKFIFNLRTNSNKNIANNDKQFVKLQTAHYPTNKWIGRWNGVEGTMLEILPNADFYDIIIHGIDNTIRVMSEKVTHKSEIVFITDDMKKHTIIAGNGVDTKMKRLDDKNNCLIIPSMKIGFCK
ncbi:hypothetical protein [Tenacibaculum dicentrarchi]|uniref:hypothetical protein n=1 Tax=Tenacibaculum dicentrarchi TaxID=669041 RepID=UPI000C7DF732|nr:hypothetical protein TDCHD05_80079 [Tenacibaculum dicentrarchi]